MRAWRGAFEVHNLDNTNKLWTTQRDRRRNLPPRIPAQKGAESPTSPSPVCSWRICAFWYHEPLRNRPQLRFDPIWVGGWLTAEATPFRRTVPLLWTSSHAFLRAACATIRRLCDPRPVFAPSDLPDLDPAPSAQEYPALRRLSNEPSFFQTPLKSHRAPPIPFPRALVESVPFGSPLARSGRGLEGLRSPCQPEQLKGEGPRAALVHPLASLVRRAGRFPRTLCRPLPTLAPRLHRLAVPSRPRPASCCSLAMG